MKRILLALVMVALALGLATCEKPAEAGKKVFVMVPKGVHPYYGPCWQGIAAANWRPSKIRVHCPFTIAEALL